MRPPQPGTRPAPDDHPCRLAARDLGLVPALERLHSALGTDVLLCGPGGHAVVPRDLAVTARRLWAGGALLPRDKDRESVTADPLLDAEGLVGLRVGVAIPATAEPLIGLAWLRLGLSERLLRDCLTYLRPRAFGDVPLLDQQLIRVDLGDAATWQVEMRAVLTGATPSGTDPADLTWVHRRITGIDRTLLRLLGGGGFRADGPGRRAAISELLADVHRSLW